MKKSTKIILIVAGGLVALGAILVGIGFKYASAMNLGFIVNDSKISVTDEEMVTGTVDLSGFDSLSIDVTSMDVKILEGDSYRLEYKCREMYVPEVKQAGDTLSIKQPTVNHMGITFGVSLASEQEYYHLIVPKMEKAVECDIHLTSGEFDNDILNLDGLLKMTSGDVTLSDISFDGRIEQTSGELTINNVTGSSAVFEKTSGDVECNDCVFEKININSTSGDATFKDISVKGFNYELTSGEIEINLNGSQNDYNFDITATSGDIEVGGFEAEKKYKQDNGASQSISGHSTSGSVDISFSK